jgi:hypothetical protein
MTAQAEKTYPIFLGGGGFGKVYRISERLAGKVLHNRQDSNRDLNVKRLRAEYNLCRRAYEGDVQVAKPFGVFEARLACESEVPLYVMEYFQGIHMDDLDDSDKKRELRRRRDFEEEKAKKLGIILPDDCELLYNEQNDTFRLVDLGFCYKKGLWTRAPCSEWLTPFDMVFKNRFKLEELTSELILQFEEELKGNSQYGGNRK